MPVSIIGTRGCGKSVVFGLLHQAMERYTNENPGEFIFYAVPEVENKILAMRSSLLRGEYPSATERKQLFEFKFLLGFMPKGIENIPFFAKKMVRILNRSSGKFGYYLPMILSLYDVSGEDITEFHRNPNEIIKKIFNANIVVIIIDSSLFTKSIGTRKFNLKLEYDRELATVLSAYCKYRFDNSLKEKLHPIIIFAKIDLIDREIRDEYRINRLNYKYDEEVAEEVGKKLMSGFLSGTNQAILGGQSIGIPLHKSKYFFSWIEEERIDGVAEAQTHTRIKTIPGSKPGEHAWNIFPTHMYEEFLKHIRELSKTYSDPKEVAEEYMKKV